MVPATQDLERQKPAATRPTDTPSGVLGAFAASLAYEDIPEAVIERARLHILDGIGIGLASTTFPFAPPTLAAVAEMSPSGPCTVMGTRATASPRDAAMANGLLMHGLDYDDTHQQAIVHATVAALPAALAMAETKDASGRELLAAYCIGMETAIRIGAAVNTGFHHTGFHATAIVSHFAAALAAGRILGSDAGQHEAALGIAASTASGIQVFLEEGAWTKRLHPGWGAAGGITAATFARSGFKAPSRPLEGRFGLFETHLAQWRKDTVESYLTEGVGHAWMMQDTALKPYPVCHFIHGAADAAIEVFPQIGDAKIREVEIRLAKDTLPIVAEPAEVKRAADTEYAAKFSAHFVVAAALLKGRFGLPELTTEGLADEAVRNLAQKCSCVIDPDSRYPSFFSGGVKVTLNDGRVLEAHVPVNSGAGERQLTEAQVSEKYFANASLAVDESRAREVREAVLGLEKGSARDLAATLRLTW